MHHLRLIGHFVRASLQEEAAYRANYALSLLYSFLNLGTGVLGVIVLFSQVESIQGWGLAGTLALLGVYLMVGALRDLCIGPSLEALAGMDGEVWSGRFDYTLLRPVSTQFLVSFRRWRSFAVFDLLLGAGVLGVAIVQLGQAFTAVRVLAFLVALGAGGTTLYAILLAFAALVFWSRGTFYTWVFGSIFQMARYPVRMYPGWLRLVLTWVVPVGVITTVPAEALTGTLAPGMLAGAVGLAAALAVAASILFRYSCRRYASASS